MFRDRLFSGIRAGILAAVVTVGAFVGLGLRTDRAFGYFSDLGLALIPSPDGLVPLPWLALSCGLAVHVLWIFIWGALFAVALYSQSRLRVALGALIASLGLVLVLLPRWPLALGVIGRVDLSNPQRWFMVFLISCALYAGARARRVSAQ